MQANVSKELHVYKRGKNECPGKDHQKCFGRVKEKAKNDRRRLITKLRQGKNYSAKYVIVKIHWHTTKRLSKDEHNV